MDTIKETKTEYPMTQAHALLAETIKSYEPDRLSEEVVASLRFMLKHPTFIPLREVIADKLIEIGEYFARREEQIVKTNLEGKPINKPKRTPDNRKKKRKVANAADAPEGSTPGPTMEFTVRGGILVPKK